MILLTRRGLEQVRDTGLPVQSRQRQRAHRYE